MDFGGVIFIWSWGDVGGDPLGDSKGDVSGEEYGDPGGGSEFESVVKAEAKT